MPVVPTSHKRYCLLPSAYCPSARSAHLLRIVNDNLRAALICNDIASNLHAFSLQRFQVAKLSFVGGKDHAGKRAGAKILAKIQEGISSTRRIHSHDKSCNAAVLTHERPGMANIHTRGWTAGRRNSGRADRWRDRRRGRGDHRHVQRPRAEPETQPHPQRKGGEY